MKAIRESPCPGLCFKSFLLKQITKCAGSYTFPNSALGLSPLFHTRNHSRYFLCSLPLFTFICTILWKRGLCNHVPQHCLCYDFQGRQLCPLAVRHILRAVRDDQRQSPFLLSGMRQPGTDRTLSRPWRLTPPSADGAPHHRFRARPSRARSAPYRTNA
jgi:hypothetical protein